MPLSFLTFKQCDGAVCGAIYILKGKLHVLSFRRDTYQRITLYYAETSVKGTYKYLVLSSFMDVLYIMVIFFDMKVGFKTRRKATCDKRLRVEISIPETVVNDILIFSGLVDWPLSLCLSS